jgi:hypothetical protein
MSPTGSWAAKAVMISPSPWPLAAVARRFLVPMLNPNSHHRS